MIHPTYRFFLNNDCKYGDISETSTYSHPVNCQEYKVIQKNINPVLREQYNSVYSKSDDNFLVDDHVTLFFATNSESPSFTSIYFERQDLVMSIVQISNNSAAGPDNFLAIVL